MAGIVSSPAPSGARYTTLGLAPSSIAHPVLSRIRPTGLLNRKPSGWKFTVDVESPAVVAVIVTVSWSAPPGMMSREFPMTSVPPPGPNTPPLIIGLRTAQTTGCADPATPERHGPQPEP